MKQWYALRTKPKREGSAAELLAAAGLEVYVPQIVVPARLGRAARTEMFFPCYFFCRLDPDVGEIRLASYTSGVLYVVGYGGQAWPLPDSIVALIKERLSRKRRSPSESDFRQGERVVIKSGPLKDTEAIFDCNLSGSGRARVLITLLKRLCHAEVHVSDLGREANASQIP